MTDTPDTRSRLLDVAEELFGEHGLGRVSVRDITEAAQVNLAAVNYHFRSKEGLIEAVFQRRVAPVNEARLAALDGLEENAGEAALAVEEILGAFIRPAVAACVGNGKGGAAFAKLFGRCLAEPAPEVEELLSRQFAPLAARFEKAFSKALPGLSRTEVYWRLKFTFGALHHFLLTKDKFMPRGLERSDAAGQMQKLIGFAAAGFRAK